MSPRRPSETSMAAVARPRKPRPKATRGSGHSMARRVASKASAGRLGCRVPRKASSARRASPGWPLTQSSSPGRAPLRSRAPPAGTSPNTVTPMASGPAVVSPPTSSQSCSSAKSSRPRAKPANQASSTRGRVRARVKPRGLAPHAARSDKFTARALCPRRAGSTVDRKCRPSTSVSVDTASCMPAAGASTAQSSPLPTTARRGPWPAGRTKYLAMRSNSPRLMGWIVACAPGCARPVPTPTPPACAQDVAIHTPRSREVPRIGGLAQPATPARQPPSTHRQSKAITA